MSCWDHKIKETNTPFMSPCGAGRALCPLNCNSHSVNGSTMPGETGHLRPKGQEVGLHVIVRILSVILAPEFNECKGYSEIVS